MSGLVQKVLDTEMGDEVLYPPFSFVYDPAFTYCASSHCNVSESNFKENLGIQNFLIHQKASNIINPFYIYATSVNVWDNKASLQ